MYPDHPADGEQFHLTTEELAVLMRTSPETCRYWRHLGKGPRSFKVGRRVLYARADVDAWIKQARDDAAVSAQGTPAA